MGWDPLPFERGDRYRTIRLLGEGGMGVVYEVEDSQTGQVVALKLLKRRGGDVLYRMKREFRALADLAHPNLIGLHDLVVDNDECYLTMERVVGAPFVAHCRPDGKPDELRLRAALPQLVRGVMALHQAGVVHRDIKPSNVLVEPGGRVVLLDFGLIAEVDSGDSLAGQVVGSIEYMAPEQAAGESAIPATDWYAVGVVLYEALTGKVPFGGTVMEILVAKQQFPAPPPRQLWPGVPEDLDDLAVALLARQPTRRPGGPEILARLGQSMGHEARAMASVSRMPAFAGRADELAELDFGLDQVDGGRCAVAVVRGPSGIGKSTLVQHWLEAVRDRVPDLLLLGGRCYERETVPYKAVDDLVDQLARYWLRLDPTEAAELVPERAAVLRRLFPVLGRVPAIADLPEGPPIRDPLEVRTQAFAAFRTLLQRIAERHRLVVFLDDMQWVDADSIALLTDLLRPPDPPRMLLVLASRTERQRAETGMISLPSRPERGGLEQLLRTPGLPVRDVDLGPLAPEDAKHLARGLLAGRDTSLAERVARESGGVPFFLRELAMWIESGARTEGEVRLDDVVRARVARLPERTRDVLRLACFAGEPVSLRVLAAAVDCSGDELAREVRTLRSTSLLRGSGSGADRVEPYHDRIREAVRAEIDGRQARELHRRLALALERWSEGDAVRLARHWSGAGEHQRAADLARDAAERAAAMVDFDRAARLYEMALDLGDYDAFERRRLGAALGVALANAGRPQEAARAFLAAADGADRASRLELRYRAASELISGGFFEDGLHELGEVLAEVGMKLAPTPGAALRSFVWRRGLLRLRGARWRERPAEEVPQRVLTTLDIMSSVALSLALVDTIRGADYQARFALAAYRVGEPARVLRALGLEAAYLASLGVERRARRLADLFEEVRVRTGVAMLPFGAWARGALHYFVSSEWKAAMIEWERAEADVRTLQSSGWALDTAQAYACFARLYLGDLPTLARVVPSNIREAERRGDLYASVNLRTRLPIVHLMRDEPDEAARDLGDALASWVPRERSFLLQHLFGLLGTGHLELYRDDPEQARRVLEDNRPLLDRSVLLRIPFVRVEIELLRGQVALACAARAGAPERAALLRDGRRKAAWLAGRDIPYARAVGTMLRGCAARIDGDHATAAADLRAALRWFTDSETGLHAAATRRRLGELIGGSEGRSLSTAADTDFTAREVEDPVAMTRVFVP